jgi:hypothetical protein
MCCLISVVMGAAAIHLHSEQLTTIVWLVSCVWLIANIAVSRAYTREYWKSLDKPISQFLREARAGRLPKSSGLERVTGLGSTILIVVLIGLELSGHA